MTIPGCGSPLLSADGLTVRRSGDGALVLPPTTLRAESGQVVLITGPSGAGKTTLLHTLLDTLPAGLNRSAGKVRWQGTPVKQGRPARRWRRSRCGWLGQDPGAALHPLWRVDRLIGEGLTTDPSARSSYVAEQLDILGLPPETAARRAAELSGGQAQRVALARALAANPALLVLDEPTSAMDPATAALVTRAVAARRGSPGRCVVVVTHDEALFGDLADVTVRVVAPTAAPGNGLTRRAGDAEPGIHAPEMSSDQQLPATAEVACAEEQPGARAVEVSRAEQARPGLTEVAWGVREPTPWGAEFPRAGRRPATGAAETFHARQTLPGTTEGDHAERPSAPKGAEAPRTSQQPVAGAPRAEQGPPGAAEVARLAQQAAPTSAPVPRTALQTAPGVTAAPHQNARLSAQRLLLTAPDGNVLLKDGTLDLLAGSSTAVIGPSGVGKTTLLHALVGRRPAAAGTLLLQGKAVPADTRHRSPNQLRAVQLAGQSAIDELNPARRVDRAVARPLSVLHGLGRAAALDEARALLAAVGLAPGSIGRRPLLLSGGQRQRVVLARALAARPDVLLLDEPTASLDPETARIVLDLLDRIRATGTAILAVTHDRAVAARADDVLALRDGLLVPVPHARFRSAAPARSLNQRTEHPHVR